MRLTMAKKLITVGILLFVILGYWVFNTLSAFSSIEVMQAKSQNVYQVRIVLANQLKSQFYQYDDNMNMYVGTAMFNAKLASSTYAAALANKANMDQAIAQFAQTGLEKKGVLAGLLSKLQANLTSYNQYAVLVHQAIGQKNIKKAIQIQTVGNLKPSNAIPPILTKITQIETNNQQKAGQSIASYIQSSRTFALLSSAIVILVILAIILYSYFVVVRFLQRSGRMVELIAVGDVSSVDLSELKVKSKDEIGQLSTAYGHMVTYVQEMGRVAQEVASGNLGVEVAVRCEKDFLGNAFQALTTKITAFVSEVQASADRLTSSARESSEAASQINEAVEQVASGSTEQAQQLSQVASVMDDFSQILRSISQGVTEQSASVGETRDAVLDMSTAVGEAAKKVQQISETSVRSKGVAETGGKTVVETISQVEEIQKSVLSTAQNIRELGESSKEIGQIVGVIADIADQTNLLALNATIEAARAGEQGRGFAVVADEVRKLAERSSLATKEIRSLIGKIQAETETAVKAMEQGIDKANAGTLKAQEAGEALTDIVKMTEATLLQVQGVIAASEAIRDKSEHMAEAVNLTERVTEETATSTTKMNESSNKVTGSIASIAAIAEENAASSEEVSAATSQIASSAQSLARMAEELAKTTKQFRF